MAPCDTRCAKGSNLVGYYFLASGSFVRILYKNKSIKALCEDEPKQLKKLGAAGAKKLQARLADIQAASHVTELLAGAPHPLSGDRIGQFAVRLDKGRRLVFESFEQPPPRKADGGIDWSCVSSICILSLEDYHD